MHFLLALFFFSAAHASPAREALDRYFRDETQTFHALFRRGERVVYRYFAPTFIQDPPALYWSSTKAVISALVGRALQEGKISLAQPACERCPARVEDLLFWNSGLDWHESYEKNPFASDIVELLYGYGSRDILGFLFAFRFGPKRFAYASGDTNLLSGLLRHAYGEAEYASLVESRLVRPLGLTKFLIEKDAAGTYIGSSSLFASAEAMAEFGALFLRRGLNQAGKRVLDAGYIDRVTHVHPDLRESLRREIHEGPFPAGQWWRRTLEDGPVGEKPTGWSSATFMAEGHWGQHLIVDPRQGWIFVRNGDNRRRAPMNIEKVGAILQALVREEDSLGK